MSWYGWRPYVPVVVRRARARQKMEKLRKKGLDIRPVCIEGRKIAHTFWGEAWCEHLEKFSDFANRLPRGRTYVRNGSVCHLEIAEGSIKAMVSGSELYNVNIAVKELPGRKWSEVKQRCAGQIGSLLELLQGRLSKSVMGVVTDRDNGLFPLPKEIDLKCSCPDWAVMCKHVAAVLYGVGSRLDEEPALLFLLRGVNQEELVSAEAVLERAAEKKEGRRRIADADLADVFGIEMAEQAAAGRRKARGAAAPAEPAKPAAAVAPASRRAAGKQARAPRKDATRAGRGAVPDIPRRAREREAPGPGRKPPLMSGPAVARLRERFGMTKAEFARLFGVGARTIGEWENTKGRLYVLGPTLRAWKAVSVLDRDEARKRL